MTHSFSEQTSVRSGRQFKVWGTKVQIFENYETNPSLDAQIDVPGSRFEVFPKLRNEANSRGKGERGPIRPDPTFEFSSNAKRRRHKRHQGSKAENPEHGFYQTKPYARLAGSKFRVQGSKQG